MKCLTCGHEHAQSGRFCSKCGALLPEPEAAESEQAAHNPPQTPAAARPKPKRKILVIGISVLALAVVAVLLIALLGNHLSAGSDTAASDTAGSTAATAAGDTAASDTAASDTAASDTAASDTAASDVAFGYALIKLYNQNGPENFFLTSEGAEIEGAELENVYRYSYSLDRSACAVVSGKEAEEKQEEIGTLYIISEEGAKEVSEDVLSCVISDDGSHIAYVAAVDDYIGDLYLYDVSAQSPVKLASNVLAADNYICISPDGKSVGYIGDYEFFMDSYVNVPSDEFIGYVYVDGEIMELGEQCYPVALSNNADFLYYFEVNDAGTDLYVKYGGTKEKLSSDELILFFNQDMSELLFDGEVVCLWSPDSGVVDISDDYTTMLSSSRYSYSKRACVDFTLMFTLPLSTFKNVMAWTSDGSDGILYVIGSEYEMIKIAEGNNPYISGSKIIYTDAYGNCYRMDDIKKDTEGRLIFENADEVYAASSLEDIYCLKGGGLYHVTSSGETKVIADGISAAALSPHDLLYFLTGDGELFSVDGDAAPVKIAEPVSGLDSYGNGVYYTADTDEGLDVYINTSGDTFVRILSGVDSIERVTVYGFEYMN